VDWYNEPGQGRGARQIMTVETLKAILQSFIDLFAETWYNINNYGNTLK